MANKTKQRQPKVPQPQKKNKGKPGQLERYNGLGKGDMAYAKLLYDPCNAPYAPGMLADGMGFQVQRFETDFVHDIATNTNVTFAICPSAMAIRNSGTISDTTNLTWGSSYAFPGSGVISAQANRFRCLAACVQVTWAGTEANRQGIVAMGNLATAVSWATTVTTNEIRTSLPYVVRTPDQTVGMKWRPTDTDVDMQLGSANSQQGNAIYLQVSGVPNNTQVRIRVVAVMEWEPNAVAGIGIPVQQYAPPGVEDNDRFTRVLAWLDKSGHWLLDNAAAIGHFASGAAKYFAG